eukprot:1495018-Amphidinium_carterae.1
MLHPLHAPHGSRLSSCTPKELEPCRTLQWCDHLHAPVLPTGQSTRSRRMERQRCSGGHTLALRQIGSISQKF